MIKSCNGKRSLVAAISTVGVLTAALGAESFARLAPEVEPGFSPGASRTEAGIWMLMDDAEEAIRRSANRVQDPDLEEYLQKIICKLAPDYCADVRVYVMRTPHFNASMAPNGMMQVWTGLLLRARNEAQIASVLGHELGHYLRRHSLTRFETVRNTMSALAFLTLGAQGAVQYGGANPGVGTAADVTQLAAIAGLFSYTRSQESEADRFGIQLMADADFDPGEAGRIWSNLIAETESATVKKPGPFPFFSTHPKVANRMKTLEQFALQLRAESLQSEAKVGTEAYHERIDAHLETWLEDQINLNQIGQSEYLFKGLLADGLPPGLMNYYLGELYRLRNADGDRDLAIGHYQAAMGDPACPAAVYRALGLIYLKSRQFELANTQFREYLASDPDLPDREMIEYYMTMGE